MNKCKRCGKECPIDQYLCDKCFDYWLKKGDDSLCICCHKYSKEDLCEECENRETPYLHEIKPNLLKDKPYEIKTLTKDEPKTRFSMLELD